MAVLLYNMQITFLWEYLCFCDAFDERLAAASEVE